MLTLYEHPFALYCQKVLVALNELGVAYDVLEEQRDFHRAELAELWPPASIPVLRDGAQVIGETSIIIEHVAGHRLVPSRYYRALAQRPSFAKVIANARPYRHLFPLPWPADFDRYH